VANIRTWNVGVEIPQTNSTKPGKSPTESTRDACAAEHVQELKTKDVRPPARNISGTLHQICNILMPYCITAL